MALGMAWVLFAGGCASGQQTPVPEIMEDFSCTVEVEGESAFFSGILSKTAGGYRFLIQYPESLGSFGFQPQGTNMEVTCHDLAVTVPMEQIQEGSVIRALFKMLGAVHPGEPAELIAENGDVKTLRWWTGDQSYFIKINGKTGQILELSDGAFQLKITFLDYEA